jgi:hypothetical protein
MRRLPDALPDTTCGPMRDAATATIEEASAFMLDETIPRVTCQTLTTPSALALARQDIPAPLKLKDVTAPK